PPMRPRHAAGAYLDLARRLDHGVKRPGRAGPAPFQLGSFQMGSSEPERPLRVVRSKLGAVIEPSGPEPPRRPQAAGRGIAPTTFVAAVLVAALAGGVVAAGVTLGILHQQARTNQQTLDLGSRVTISEDTATANGAAKAQPAVVAVASSDSETPRGSGFLVTSDG